MDSTFAGTPPHPTRVNRKSTYSSMTESSAPKMMGLVKGSMSAVLGRRHARDGQDLAGGQGDRLRHAQVDTHGRRTAGRRFGHLLRTQDRNKSVPPFPGHSHGPDLPGQLQGMPSQAVPVGHPAQLRQLDPLADFVHAELHGAGEPEGIPRAPFVEGRVGRHAIKEVPERRVQVPQRLL
jgi:hypothetical protein